MHICPHHRYLVTRSFNNKIPESPVLNAVFAQLQIRTTAVQRQGFRGADGDFILTAGHRELLVGSHLQCAVLGANFYVAQIGDNLLPGLQNQLLHVTLKY